MMTAARIFGDHVASAAPLFLAFLVVHVLAGLTAVITGAIAALVRKGSPRHIRAGRWYYRAITVVFVTATVLAAMRWRQDYYLFIIGAVAFTAATVGYQHRRRHRPGDTGHIVGHGRRLRRDAHRVLRRQRPAPAAGGPPAGPGVLAAPLGHRRPAHRSRGHARPALLAAAPDPPGRMTPAPRLTWPPQEPGPQRGGPDRLGRPARPG